MNPRPTASQKVVRHFIACARVLISATRSLNPTQIETEMWVSNQNDVIIGKIKIKTTVPTRKTKYYTLLREFSCC